jgi:hypothetical protein
MVHIKIQADLDQHSNTAQFSLLKKSSLKNLAVLSIYIPDWLPVDADQGFGFTKLSGYRRI